MMSQITYLVLFNWQKQKHIPKSVRRPIVGGYCPTKKFLPVPSSSVDSIKHELQTATLDKIR